MTKYKVVNVCVQETSYSEHIKCEELEKAFEEGWEYVAYGSVMPIYVKEAKLL